YGGLQPGLIAASYLGVFAIGAHYLAIGVCMSSLTQSQVVAAMLTFLVLSVLFILGLGEMVLSGPAQQLAAYVSVWTQMADFAHGVVDLRYLIFDASLAALMLLVATQMLALEPWR
ncbi:MAG: hypothetical protein ACPGUV_11955, partial [Polyangiales bacterium]